VFYEVSFVGGATIFREITDFINRTKFQKFPSSNLICDPYPVKPWTIDAKSDIFIRTFFSIVLRQKAMSADEVSMASLFSRMISSRLYDL
jgi:hypothetical protein